MKRVFSVFVTAVLCIYAAKAQTLRLGKTMIDLQNDSTYRESAEKIFREDFKPYLHLRPFMQVGYIANTSADALARGSRLSMSYDIGFRLLYRASRHYSVGGAIRLGLYSYSTDGLAGNGAFSDVPIAGGSCREQILYTPLGLEFSNRFHFARGSVDIAMYGECGIDSPALQVISKADGRRSVMQWADFNVFNRFSAGAQLAFTYSYLSVYARYRFTDMFRKSVPLNEPARLSIGLMFEF